MTGQKISIRQAIHTDAAMIADLSRQTFQDSFARDNEPGNMEKFMNGPFSRENLIAELDDARNIFLIAEQDGQSLGYLKLRDSEHPKEMPSRKAIEIARIYVTKNALGRGLGGMLMEAAIDAAIKDDREIIWLGVWEHNLRAQAFYRKWGFEQFGSHIFMLGDDAQTDILMKKQIG